MSYTLGVYRSPGFEVRDDEMVFFAWIDSITGVHKYWIEPAEELGLPLLASLREEGPLQVSGDQLEGLKAELSTLWDHLARTVPLELTVSTSIPGRGDVESPRILSLLNAVSVAKQAVELAQSIDGGFEMGG